MWIRKSPIDICRELMVFFIISCNKGTRISIFLFVNNNGFYIQTYFCLFSASDGKATIYKHPALKSAFDAG